MTIPFRFAYFRGNLDKIIIIKKSLSTLRAIFGYLNFGIAIWGILCAGF